jgi:5-formyltetrahydrofolate cyclo-ligase
MTDGPFPVAGDTRKAKCLMRKEVLSRRDAIVSRERTGKDEKIRQVLFSLPLFKQARTVLFYSSFRGEADTFELMRFFLSIGGSVVLPRVNEDRRDLTLYEIKNPDELVPGCFGVPEPLVSADNVRDEGLMDLIIVPGTAFDTDCYRLGYGKGFYDKLLHRKGCPAVALAYEEQIVPFVPHESHDVRMDMIITDKGIIVRHG